MNHCAEIESLVLDSLSVSSLPKPECWHGHTIPLQDDLVLVREGSSDLFVLNGTAHLIWELWQEGQDLQGIIEHLSKRFDISQEIVSADVKQTVAEWEQAGLIGNASPKAPSESNVTHDNLPAGENAFSRVPNQWHSECCYQFVDCIIYMRFATEEIAKSLHPLFSHLSATDFQSLTEFRLDLVCGTNSYELREGDELIFFSDSLDGLAMGVTSCVIQKVYNSGNNLMGMHAGAVAHNDHCIVMPGASGCGKSTLTAALVHSGLTYLSDEVVPLDRSSLDAVPLPLCLNIKKDGLSVLGDYVGEMIQVKEYRYMQRSVYYLQPCQYQENSTVKRYPVKYMLFPCYKKNAAVTLSPLSAATALQRLITTKSMVSRPTDIVNIKKLLSWIQSISIFEIQFGSLQDAVKQIKNLFEDTEGYYRSV